MSASDWYFKFITLLMPLLIVTCSISQLHRPAPDFSRLDSKSSDTQSVMQTLAISISRMEDAMIRERTTDERLQYVNTQLQIIEELGELLDSDSSDALTGRNSTRNHQVVYDNIDYFLLQVKGAREELLQQPPNYLLVARVTDYCAMCHQVRDEGIE